MQVIVKYLEMSLVVFHVLQGQFGDKLQKSAG